MIKEILLKRILSDETEMRYSQLVLELNPIEKSDLTHIRAYYEFKKNSLVSLIEQITPDGDESELDIQLPHVWLNYRLEWNLLNLQMQYETFGLGQAKKITMGLGAVLSNFIDIIETYLDPVKTHWVNSLATDVMAPMVNQKKLTDRITEITYSTFLRSHFVTHKIFEVKQTLKNLNNDQIEQKLYEKIDDLAVLSSKNSDIADEDVIHILNNTILSGLKLIKLKFTINQEINAIKVFRPETVHIINQILGPWVTELIKKGIEETIESREKNNKSQHINFNWKIYQENDRIKFEFRDDGCGDFNYKINKIDDSGLQLKIQTQTELDKGSKLIIDLLASPLNKYLVFSTHKNNSQFSVPMSEVSHFETIALDENGQPLQNLFQKSQNSESHLKIFELDQVLKLNNACDRKMYIVLNKDSSNFSWALPAHQIDGIVYSKIESNDQFNHSPYLQGFIHADGQIVNLLNIDSIKKSRMRLAC